MKRLRLQNGRKLKNILFVLLLQITTLAAASQVRISGKITGTDGNGIPGISVVIRNTGIGTSTGTDGTYNLNADIKAGNYMLDFTGVGFKSKEQALQVGSETAYTSNAQLAEDALKLDEVVITGASAGTTRKQLGSYVSTVKADQLTKGATGNVLAALQGKTAGAQIIQNSGDPAGGLSVRLRGISSVNSSSEPLYIVDGVIVNNATNRVTNTSGNYDGSRFVGTIGQNRMSDINPADIERIEVLNGAAAAAIYGSRANAGVVQIFTKRGSSGAPVVSVNTSVIISELRKSVPVNQSPTKFGGPTDGPGAQTQDILTPALTNTTPVSRYDYNDYIFQTGIGTDNNVSVSGGKDKTKYYTSASYYKNEGIIKNTDYRRYTFRVNLDQALGDKVNFNIGLNYINSFANEKPDGNSFFSPMNSINIIGNFHDLFTRDALGNIKAIGERGRVNPVSIIEDIKQKQETNRIIAGAGLKFRPIKGLTFDYTLGIDQYSQRGQTFIPPFAYNVSDGFFGGGAGLDPTRNGYASTATNDFFQINNELNGTYQFKITDNLGSTTQVGYSVQYEKNNYSMLQGRGLAPFVQTVNGASTVLPGVDGRGELSVSGYYLQQNFKFKNQFFVTGAVRVDGSSVFGEDQRSQVYLKGSGSYVISESPFWEKSMGKWWNLAKIRIAYGESGNLTGIGAYDRFNAYSTNSYLSRTALFSSSVLANENVKPERQKELEIGTDLAFIDNRLSLQFNYYIKKVSDLLIDRIIAPTTGFSSLLDNYGSLENKGFEIVLSGSPVRTKDFNWSATLIYNHNRNKAVRTGAPAILATNSGTPVAIIEGQPIGVFYGAFFAVDNSGNWVKNASGFPQAERGIQNSALSYTVVRDPVTGLPVTTAPNVILRKVIGDPNPDWTGSLVNELSYKKASLRIQLDAVQGNEVFNADWRTRQGVGNGKEAEKEQTGVYPRGYISSFYGVVEQWRIDDGSFVKLREVSLGYNFGTFKSIKDITLAISGRNLISWDNYKGYDPEVNAGGQSTILRGIDFGPVPIPRTYSLSLSAKF
jgi:TonB-linked SusC/RagA family outer membrane protein